MSGFDVQMRSQQMVNQSQQFYDSQRYASMDQMGRSLMQGPGIVQEIMHRQQDAKMRLSLQEQEFQQNNIKLQAMMAIDQADLSRENLRSLKLQNDAMQQDIQLRNRDSQLKEQQLSQNSAAEMLRAAGGLPGLVESGMTFDFSTKSFRALNEDERKQFTRQTYDAQNRLNEAEKRRAFESEFDALQKLGRFEEAEQLLNQYRGVPSSAASSSNAISVKKVEANISKALQSRGENVVGLPASAAPHIANWMVSNRGLLLDQMKRAAKSNGWSQDSVDKMTEDQAIEAFTKLLNQHGSPQLTAFIEFMNARGAFRGMLEQP